MAPPKETQLFNEKTFYQAFIKDMLKAEREVIIYSPFISKYRVDFLGPTLSKLRKRNIDVFIFTRPIEEHDFQTQREIESTLKECEELGITVIYLKGSIHEKVAIIDQKILWEGSLNILSQRISRELMRRIPDEIAVAQLLNHLELENELKKGHKSKYDELSKQLAANRQRTLSQKAAFLVTGLIIPFISWWLFLIFRVMILALKGFVKLMDLVCTII